MQGYQALSKIAEERSARLLSLRAFHEKAFSVKPTVAAVTVLEDRDDCALTLASIRTVDGSAFW